VTMYVLPKKDALRMIAALAEDYELYGPVLQDVSGEPLFDRAQDPADIRLDAAIPYNPPKGALFPQSERILSYSYDAESRKASIRRDDLVRPKALVGLRSCDLNGLLCLDRFFLGQEYVDDVYRDHRKKMFIVANTCVRPFPQCFCVCTDSGPSAREGFDVNLTEAGEDYLFEAGSEKGEALAKKLGLKEAGPAAAARKGAIVDASIARFDAEATENKAWISRVVNRITTGLIGNEVWEYIGDQCFECGGCAFVCPTCTCFNVYDQVRSPGSGLRLRAWDACLYGGFTREASGHNPRGTQPLRLKRRHEHKLLYYNESDVGEALCGCVGCGRCSDFCPVHIGTLEITSAIAESR